MKDKEAIEILEKLLEKDFLTAEEKEAVVTAIGALGWFDLGKNRMDRIIKSQKAKRDRMRRGE